MIEINDVVTNGNTFVVTYKNANTDVPFLFRVIALDDNEAWVLPLNGNYINDGRLTFKTVDLILVEKNNA